ncbi:MAG: hypothetical protein AAF152_02490 [Cyanobacteria bacterium P01_A01_bin.114]
MRIRAAIVAFLVGLIGLLSCITAAPTYALTQIDLQDLDYKTCPAEYSDGIVGAGSMVEATCYLVTGKAINQSGRPVLNADIFGFIYDANNDSVMRNRTRLGSIDYVPPGESDFELRISVASNQPPPLKLKNFKASGFAGKVRR